MTPFARAFAVRMRERIAALTARLGREEGGNAAIEFAIVAPVFLTLLIGTFDLGQMVYAKSILSGAVEQAARSSSLQGGNTVTADKMVGDMVKRVLPGVTISSQRMSYFDFADIKRPEKWNDADADATCNNGEGYMDENGNGIWDSDIGVSGNGGASDVIIYTVTATYSPVFKIPFAPQSWNQRSLSSTAVRKNQPFAQQTGYSTGAGTCP